eukprot:PhF_6_TR44455/c0_g1_i1/m.68431/K00773/tgt, QTRT1; queuine tRNA-ribosyltransferase
MSSNFQEIARFNHARRGVVPLTHGPVQTPVFMPVGTQGAMKGITYEQMRSLGCEILLGNTYHLGLRPGEETMREIGGLHTLTGWDHNILTDSGGFQMVSLLSLANVTEEGVEFESSHDGTKLLLRPEDSIRIQNALGSDIMMQLDDVVHVSVTGPRLEEATERSVRWLDRCIAANRNPTRHKLFGIIQGATNLPLRRMCIQEMVKRDCPGYAIGGLSGGEAKDEFWRAVAECTKLLPQDKPRYLMGVGYPVDLVVCVALGVDMFDCVYPCRTARFGTALTSQGLLQLGKPKFKQDLGPLDPECNCTTCTKFTRSALSEIAGKESVSASLLSLHNISYLLNLMRGMRKAIEEGKFPQFVRVFMGKYFPGKAAGGEEVPVWVTEALAYAGISLSEEGLP